TGGDHRMLGRMRVLGRMFVRRGITAKRDAARLTCPQMDPAGADLHTLRALSLLRKLHMFRVNRVDMRTSGGHAPSLSRGTRVRVAGQQLSISSQKGQLGSRVVASANKGEGLSP